jgi:hypothetical protein
VAREIDGVHTRCRLCGQATWLTIRTTDLDDEGQPYVVVMAEPVPHSPADCEAFTRLERETWPTLW